MAEIVLILREATGRVKFDSRRAVGGICLGIFTVGAGGSTFSFNGMGTGLRGIALNPVGAGVPAAAFSYTEALGYPQFKFTAGAAGMTVALFVK